jgi:hypothetical protein
MSLDDYQPPKGAYYTPAIVARFDDAAEAEDALEQLRAAGFTTRDIQVAQGHDGVMVIVSEPTPGMLGTATAVLNESAAGDVHPYGAGDDRV